MLTIEQFTRELTPLVERYKTDNAWVKWWTDEDIYYAWRMYKTSSTASLGFLLLGDTKIRKDQTLLMNFGTATANNIQEENERRVIAEISDRRKVMSYGTKGIKYETAKGTGSVLSDDKWTPMLNDSFMMGGIHSGSQFHLAEDFFFAKTSRLGAISPQEKWLHFFKNNPLSFWAAFGPRVFSRECICLKAAGYRPNFSDHGLVFTCPASPLTFEQCLQAVTQSGLTGGNKNLVIQNISDFLFNDKNALKYP
jgi:hypothetical protein